MATGLPHLWDAMVGSLRNNIHINNFGNCTSDLSWGRVAGWSQYVSLKLSTFSVFTRPKAVTGKRRCSCPGAGEFLAGF